VLMACSHPHLYNEHSSELTAVSFHSAPHFPKHQKINVLSHFHFLSFK
jgi:hypothetical protein